MTKMPALFMGHGSPMNAIEDNIWSQSWKKIGEELPLPKAILSISAHWMTPQEGIFVDAQEKPKTIHDFYGFPQALFDIQYPASGSLELAKKISTLVPEITSSNNWGIDHGTWSVLVHLFPNANIPVIQISLDLAKPFSWHYELGKKLASLRNEGVLVLGSGNIVHNLRKIDWENEYFGHPWAKEFDQWVVDQITNQNHSALLNPFTAGEKAHLSIPTADHYLPLLYVLATQDQDDQVSFPVEGYSLGSLSMRAVMIK